MKSLSTLLIHAGEPRIEGAVIMPIFQTANFEARGEDFYQDIKYTRLNNCPNHLALHDKLCAIENAEAALVTSSGMAAVSSVFFGLLSAGDHILIQQTVYGGTHSVMTEDLKRFGITYDFIDATKPDTWAAKLKPSTKMVYVESISNPLMEIPELQAIADFAKAKNLVSVIDNTFATPVNFRPADIGFHLSLHSATKYLNGHSDIIAGCILGKKDVMAKIKHFATHMGGMLDPHACFLLHRGMKTLAVRMQHQNESALKIAKFLATHKAVERVNYPGLETSPSYKRAQTYMRGQGGGMISFEIKGELLTADRFISKLRLAIHAASLGGVESLVIQPARSSHLALTPDERHKAGIRDSLIRLSVGLEATEDLIADLDQALSAGPS
jgi:cystathionine beta-lyase/cystathionine gamma-synthase